MGKKISAGDIYKTNRFGDVVVIDYRSCFDISVKFLTTGTVATTTSHQLRIGQVRDPMHPYIYGVGFSGIGKYSAASHRNIYTTWHSMITRCYSSKFHLKNKTYKDCNVCEEWHNFQNFAEWMLGQDYIGKQLDKDIKIEGNKTYSPETCMFVTHRENAIKSSSKTYTLTSPCGDIVTITNLHEFSRVNGLDSSHMNKVCRGKINSYKGWTAAKE